MNTRRFIAIDQGNTCIKLYLMEDGASVEFRRLEKEETEEIFSVIDAWRPEAGVFCSVGHKDPRMMESLRIALEGRLLILSHTTPLPVKVDYATPQTLGLDRVVLAAGAASLFPGETSLIADAGTAVTLDLLDSDSTFRGGRISLGLKLRFKSLHDFTASLPLVGAEGDTPKIGGSTETSIRSGVVRGLGGEITATYHQYRKFFGCSRLILSGGDASLLSRYISPDVPCAVVTDLMARGLFAIYRHNEKND